MLRGLRVKPLQCGEISRFWTQISVRAQHQSNPGSFSIVHLRYEEVQRLAGFLRDADELVPYVSELWAGGAGSSGQGSYLDFTSSGGYGWWKGCLKAQLLDYGMEAVWNDNNEYEVADDAVRLGNGGALGAMGRPLQALLMARASREALVEHNPTRRPFVVSRSACLGAQRYCSQSWSGDNYTSWRTLRYNLPMGLGLSLCGFPNTGHDIGVSNAVPALPPACAGPPARRGPPVSIPLLAVRLLFADDHVHETHLFWLIWGAAGGGF